jgi:phytoene dehydrogenase-like protein
MVEELDDMTGRPTYDAVVVGAGPNGFAAAVELARHGCCVAVVEAESTIGGSARSAELTLPGYVHDLGSAIHPFGYASPFFRSLPLEDHGLEWIHPPAPLAHPFDDGTAAMLERSTEDTGATLGPDAEGYRKMMDPLVEDARRIETTLTGSLQAPRHPISLAAAGLRSLLAARGRAERLFVGEKARGLFAGNAAHSFLPLEKPPSALFGFLFGTLGHAFGWPFPKGGSQRLVDALASYLASLGARSTRASGWMTCNRCRGPARSSST